MKQETKRAFGVYVSHYTILKVEYHYAMNLSYSLNFSHVEMKKPNFTFFLLYNVCSLVITQVHEK